jgi:electron transfer flavoprotein alpha subunit
MTTTQGILAVVDTDGTGSLTGSVLEMLGAAAALRDGLGGALMAAIVAPDGAPALADLASRGVELILRIPPPAGPYGSAFLTDVATLALREATPSAAFFTGRSAGAEAAARVAARLGWAIVGNCSFLRVDDGTVRFGRPCLGGEALAQVTWAADAPVIVTVAPEAFAPAPARAGLSAEVIELATPDVAAEERVMHVREILPPPEALDITEAEVVVAGGAGVGGREGFALLNQLAGRLGGTLAASRVAVDRGWVPRQRQVGQTGKSVAPKVYLAFGISGAPQHIAGIRNAGKVVAVNQDPRAPIFEVADLAVAADLHELVPALIERLDGRNGAGAAERR